MSRFLKIGLFVLLTGTSSSYYILQTADTLGGQKTYTVKTVMEDAGGLLPSSAVEMAGVKVGKIRSIELQDGNALITMEIASDISLYPDARVEKKMESMLGSSVLQINPGTKQQKKIDRGGYITKVSSKTSMDKALGGAGDTAAEATALLKDIRSLLNERGGMDNLAVILDEVRRTSESSSRLIEENLRLMEKTMTNLAAISERYGVPSQPGYEDLEAIRTSTARITERLDSLLQDSDGDMEASLSAVKESLVSLRRTMERVETISADLEEGKGTAGKLLQEEELYDQVLAVSRDVNDLVGSISRMETQINYHASYRLKRADIQQALALRLIPEDSSRYYSFGAAQVPNGNVTKTTTQTVTTGTKSENYTTEETVTSSDILLNAVLGHTYGPVSLYGGIIEGSSGLGAVYQPFDQLAVKADLYDFSQVLPKFRAGGLIYPFFDPQSENLLQWIYLTGGGEDLLNPAGRDYYLGVGLRYSDENLKTLVPFVPAP